MTFSRVILPVWTRVVAGEAGVLMDYQCWQTDPACPLVVSTNIEATSAPPRSMCGLLQIVHRASKRCVLERRGNAAYIRVALPALLDSPIDWTGSEESVLGQMRDLKAADPHAFARLTEITQGKFYVAPDAVALPIGLFDPPSFLAVLPSPKADAIVTVLGTRIGRVGNRSNDPAADVPDRVSILRRYLAACPKQGVEIVAGIEKGCWSVTVAHARGGCTVRLDADLGIKLRGQAQRIIAAQRAAIPPAAPAAVAPIPAVVVEVTVQPAPVDLAERRRAAARKAVATRRAGLSPKNSTRPTRSEEERRAIQKEAGRKAAETRRNNIINQARA